MQYDKGNYDKGNQTQGAMMSTPPPSQPGIASAIQNLQAQVATTRKLAYSVRCALGIQSPENDAKNAAAPSSLMDVLSDLRRTLSDANDDLEFAITHINS